MKRLISLIAFIILISSSIAGAQTLTSITIGTTGLTASGIAGTNPVFLVDGTLYSTTQVFVWPVGSKHIVQFPFSVDANGNALPYQSQSLDNIRYAFGGWTASNSLLTPSSDPIQTITGDPTLTSLIAQVTTTYRMHILFSDLTTAAPGCTGAPGDAPQTGTPMGVIYVSGTCYTDSTTNLTDPFVTAGPAVINAFPYPGWVFYAWLFNGVQSFTSSLNVVGPLTVTPLFSVAKRVDFLSNPLGLTILVDGAVINTPPAGTAASDGVSCAPDVTRLPPNAPPGFTPLCYGQFDFLPGSKHTIGATVPQYDAAGTLWSFSGFSNGLGQNAVYTVPSNTNGPDTITANFVRGVRISITSNPSGLKMLIDGRDNWQAYNFVWGQGETHTLSAESPQNDASGRAWQFVSWSDKGAQTHTITVPAGVTDYAVAATYAELGQLTVTSSPATLNFNIDGSTCVTPCVTNKISGSTSQITVPASIPAGAGARYDFVNWSDGNTSNSRTVTYSQNAVALTANYQTSFQFTTISNPAKGGTFTFSPATPDGFFASGTTVTVTAVANNGYKFAHWEGDLTGTFASGTLTMSNPHAAQADFTSVPFIPPSGIQSVTGPTPDGSVAPGSLISIYGTNLAAAMVLGPADPLSQSVGNVTVTVGNSLLPLVFVSPDQIGAQVPWELAPGSYTLVVHNTGQADVPGTFTVSRDAPGAFTQVNAQNAPLALALHHDGSVINFSSPATVGEQVTIYGTGFGPYVQPSIDGFPSAAASTTLVDSLSLSLGAINTGSTASGTAQVQADSAGPAPGIVGVAIVKLTITSGMADSPNMTVTFQVNGKPSAPVVLPVQ